MAADMKLCDWYHDWVKTYKEGAVRDVTLRKYVIAEKRLSEVITRFVPEQAIAATLGNGTLTAEQVSKATYAHSIHADCADADWQAIADELNAELGSEREKALEELVRDMYEQWAYSIDGYYRWLLANYRKRMAELGLEVGR